MHGLSQKMWRRQNFFLQRVEEQQEGERNEDMRLLKTRFVLHKEVMVRKNANAVGVGIRGTIGRHVIELYFDLSFTLDCCFIWNLSFTLNLNFSGFSSCSKNFITKLES